MSETKTPAQNPGFFSGLTLSSEMALFGFLLNLCGVLAIIIGCGIAVYQYGWLQRPFDIKDFADGIGRLIQDDLVATGVLSAGMGVKAKLGG